MNNKQQVIFTVMIAAILIVVAAGLGAIALLRRNGRSGLKVSIKAAVIVLLIVFSVIAINIVMLGLNEG
jgi:hypothetical protein